MDIKALDKAAMTNQVMSEGLNPFEQAYYIASRGLYQQYADKKLTLEQARMEKVKVLDLYQEGMEHWKFFMELHVIEQKLQQLKSNGFDSVLEFEILESIEQILHREK